MTFMRAPAKSDSTSRNVAIAQHVGGAVGSHFAILAFRGSSCAQLFESTGKPQVWQTP